MKQPKLLFLYTELASYTIACMKKLCNAGCEVHVVRYRVNKEAPFVFDEENAIKFYDRHSLKKKELENLIEQLDPALIICSGWIDKEYVAVCKKYAKKNKTVLALDNKWTGSLKQFVASIAGKFTISKYFNYAWVPGEKQAHYAQKLGFRSEKIFRGFYSCDQNYFQSIYLNSENEKRKKYPHRFIFAGRYYEFKGVRELWQAFIELKAETKNDWELWCLGTGDVIPLEHPSIKHFGFVQPAEMEKFMKETGVFILPSRFEPWGVVLHEFAAAGFPLLCSDEVGASEAFLIEKENGFIFKANNKADISSAMKKIISLSDNELMKMGERSNELSKKITTDTWTDSVLKMIREK